MIDISSITRNDKSSCREISILPNSCPLNCVPLRLEVTTGVNFGHISSNWACIGAVIVMLKAEVLPEFITSIVCLGSSIIHCPKSLTSTEGTNIS